MQPSIFLSIVYVIAFLGLVTGIYILRKTEEKIYAATWVPFCVVAVMCYQTLVAALLNFVYIPVNIISVGIMDIFAAVIIWWKILHDHRKQQYIYQKIDLIMFTVLVIVVALFSLRRYGTGLILNYSSIDGASHLCSAMNAFVGQRLDAMYYACLHNALLIETFAPLFTAGTYYKIYVMGDIMHLFLAGMVLWGVIRSYAKDRFMRIAGIIVTILYLLGYPANSTLFGFSYLGMSMTVILFLIAAVHEKIEQHISDRWIIAFLSLGCLAVFESYMLFVPVIFFGILIWLFIDQHKNGRLFSGNTIVRGLAIFLLPTLIGLLFSYREIFGSSSGLTVETQISLEGGIYRNLFTNFLLLIPFAVVGVVHLLKNKTNSVVIYFLLLEIPFTLVLFFLALDRRVSGYYYYKNYFIIWIFLFVAAYIGLGVIEKQGRMAVTSGFCVWCVLVVMFILNIDTYIYNKNELLYGNASIRPFMEVYAFNYDFLNAPAYNTEKVALYSYVRDNMLDEGITDKVDLVGNWEDSIWMRAVVGEWIDNYDVQGMIQEMTKDQMEYVVVLYDTGEYNIIQNERDKFQIIYENSVGYIARVK